MLKQKNMSVKSPIIFAFSMRQQLTPISQVKREFTRKIAHAKACISANSLCNCLHLESLEKQSNNEIYLTFRILPYKFET